MEFLLPHGLARGSPQEYTRLGSNDRPKPFRLAHTIETSLTSQGRAASEVSCSEVLLSQSEASLTLHQCLCYCPRGSSWGGWGGSLEQTVQALGNLNLPQIWGRFCDWYSGGHSPLCETGLKAWNSLSLPGQSDLTTSPTASVDVHPHHGAFVRVHECTHSGTHTA